MLRTKAYPITLRPLLLVPLLFSLAACRGQQAATDANFTRAIQTYEKTHPGLLCGLANTGVTKASQAWSRELQRDAWFQKYFALQRLGYVTVKNDVLDTVPTVVVTVTPKYLQAFGNPQPGGVARVCYGTVALGRVQRFTQPAELLGAKVSQVEGAVTQTVEADWAKDQALTKLLGFAIPPADGQRTYLMVLKDDGWAVDSVRN